VIDMSDWRLNNVPRHVWYSPRTGRLGRFDTSKQLTKHPHQVVVILTSEDFGDETSTFAEEFGR